MSRGKCCNHVKTFARFVNFVDYYHLGKRRNWTIKVPAPTAIKPSNALPVMLSPRKSTAKTGIQSNMVPLMMLDFIAVRVHNQISDQG